MKNFLLIFGIFMSTILSAQIPVTDVAANASINSQGMGIQTKIGTTNTRLNNIKNKIKDMNKDMNERLDKMDDKLNEIQNLEQKEEDALWEVPDYISNGDEINSIFDSETNIISVVSDIFSIISNSNFGDMGKISDFLNNALDVINTYMDKASNVCMNDTYRMPVNERIKMLTSIDSELKSLFNGLKNIKSEVEVYASQRDRAQENDQKFNDAINKGVIIND